ncbi:MAG: tRNA pseudouridine(38-40) synthase TruA [Gammaproteobacteria bacterium]|nr:tRNA pseudouridine(38-40) synthase TruA [Gammaproteobacteria bacterium]
MKIAMGVEYDGSHFCGWQSQVKQIGLRTVQGRVEQALAKVAGEPVKVICAGRTDTGVHAVSQVIHFETVVNRPLKAWLMGGNSHLPADVNFLWAQPVADDFHARFKATARSYRYVILNRPMRSALLREKVTWVYRRLDEALMNEGAQYLLGKHDFTSFRSCSCQAPHPNRSIHSVTVHRQGDYLYIDITANAFLHNMVRIISGVLLAVGKGERQPNWVADVLAAKDRTVAGMTAPGRGLYFISPCYPTEYRLPKVHLPRF